MCTQLDLEIMCKGPRKKIPFDCHEFWSEEVYTKKYPKKKKTMMF
jgi:hypothetical protein